MKLEKLSLAAAVLLGCALLVGAAGPSRDSIAMPRSVFFAPLRCEGVKATSCGGVPGEYCDQARLRYKVGSGLFDQELDNIPTPCCPIGEECTAEQCDSGPWKQTCDF